MVMFLRKPLSPSATARDRARGLGWHVDVETAPRPPHPYGACGCAKGRTPALVVRFVPWTVCLCACHGRGGVRVFA